MSAWERLPDETEPAWNAFKTYLDMDDRSYIKVAERLKKSSTLIYRWASKYNWGERARAWDNSILEEAREEIKRSVGRRLLKQWKQSIALQDKSFDEIIRLLAKNPRSLKSLTELYNAAADRQWTLADRAGVDERDNELHIIIEDAGKGGDAE